MKIATLGILLFMHAGTLTGAGERSHEAALEEVQQTQLWERRLQESSTMPQTQKIPYLQLGLRNMGWRKALADHDSSIDSIYFRIQETLIGIPGHAQYFADKIKLEQESVKGMPNKHVARNDYDDHRGFYIKGVLMNLPSPETVHVLGEFLSDDLDLLSTPRGFSIKANSSYAIEALIGIGLRNSPQKEAFTDSDQDIELWRTWYSKVKAGDLAFSFLGQSVEYRFKPDGTWETVAMDDPSDDAPKPVTAERPDKNSVPSPAPKQTSPPGNSWLTVVGIAIAMLVAVLFWRKSGRILK